MNGDILPKPQSVFVNFHISREKYLDTISKMMLLPDTTPVLGRRKEVGNGVDEF